LGGGCWAIAHGTLRLPGRWAGGLLGRRGTVFRLICEARTFIGQRSVASGRCKPQKGRTAESRRLLEAWRRASKRVFRRPVSPPVGVIVINWPSAISSSSASGLASHTRANCSTDSRSSGGNSWGAKAMEGAPAGEPVAGVAAGGAMVIAPAERGFQAKPVVLQVLPGAGSRRPQCLVGTSAGEGLGRSLRLRLGGEHHLRRPMTGLLGADRSAAKGNHQARNACQQGESRWVAAHRQSDHSAGHGRDGQGRGT